MLRLGICHQYFYKNYLLHVYLTIRSLDSRSEQRKFLQIFKGVTAIDQPASEQNLREQQTLKCFCSFQAVIQFVLCLVTNSGLQKQKFPCHGWLKQEQITIFSLFYLKFDFN